MTITSILDTDLYKFTTSYAYIKLFPYAMGTFTFSDRDHVRHDEGFLNALKKEIADMATIRLTADELDYMSHNCRFLPLFYWEWLASFRFEPEKVKVWLDDEQHLHMEITDLLYKVTLYEVPLLAIVSELSNTYYDHTPEIPPMLQRLQQKIDISDSNAMPFSEFGTRRRFSYVVQDKVVAYLKEHSRYCTGTSNCHFAMKYRMKIMEMTTGKP